MPLASLLDGGPGRVPIAFVLGIDDPEVTRAAVAEALAAGWPQVKLKVQGLDGLRAAAAIVAASPPGTVGADANGSLRSWRTAEDLSTAEWVAHHEAADADAAAAIAAIAAAARGLAFLEQPFPPRAEGDHSRLVSAGVPVRLDEAPYILERVVDSRAATSVVVKAAHLAGLRNAASVVRSAAHEGLGVVVGGLLESGIGRAAALALATHPGVSAPCDLPPPDYLEHDLLTDPIEYRDGHAVVPDAPGLGVTVDEHALDAYTIERAAAP
jgi:O-succinylbenzoate synthase